MQTEAAQGCARRVQIVAVGPRDWLQNEAVMVGTDAKVAYIRALVEAGAIRIEGELGAKMPALLGRAGDFPAGPRTRR